MPVNSDIWGLPADWVDGSTNEQKADIKYPVSAKDTYKEQYNTNSLEWNTTDLSPAFWGIGKGSILAHPHYLSAHSPDGELTNIEITAESVIEPQTIPAVFTERIGTSYPPSLSYNYRYKYIDGEHQTSSYPQGNAYQDKVVMSFNYQKIMAFGQVKVTSSITSTPVYLTLDEFITNYDNYIDRYIIGFSYGVCFGDGETMRPTATTGCFIPYVPVSIPGKNITYNNVSFFAKSDGMSIALMSYPSGNTCNPLNNGEINNSAGNAMVGDSVTGFAYRYCKGSGTDVNLYYYDDTNSLWEILKGTRDVSASQTNWMYCPAIKITAAKKDDIIEYVLSQLAYIGLPFTTDPSNARTAKIGDADVYLPVFDENGITTGEYKEGAAALTLPNAEWDDARTGSGYDPTITPESDLDNVTGRNLNYWASSKYYLMTQDDLNKFLHIVNGLYTGGTTPEEKAEKVQNMQVDFKGSNPSDYIVALYGLPFQWVWPRTSFQPVMLGPVEILHNDALSDTAIMQVNPDSDCTLFFGEIAVPALGNFLDYAPYTKMMLYVPFVGTIDIDPVDYAGQTMRIEGTLDKQTGELAIRIMRNGVTVTNTLTANLYIQIPITAQAMGNYENNLHQLQMAGFNRALGNLTGAVTGGVSMGAAAAATGEGGGGGTGGLSPTAPISMAANLISLPVTMADYDYRITHCQPSVFYSSSASSANQAKFYRKCKLFIKRPVFLSGYTSDEERSVYAHTVGHACSIIGTITSSGISGFCQIGSIDLSGIPATVEEINAIKQALNKGVYV